MAMTIFTLSLVGTAPSCEAAPRPVAAVDRTSEAPSLSVARKAFAAAVQANGPDAAETLLAELVLQSELVGAQRFEEALPHTRHVRDRLRQIHGPANAEVKTMTRWIGMMLTILGRTEEAAAETASNEAGSSDDKTQVQELMAKSAAAAGAGRYAEAETAARKASELARKVYGPEDPMTKRVGTILASLVALQGREAEAAGLGRAAVSRQADDPAAIRQLARTGAVREARDLAEILLARRRSDPAARGAGVGEAAALLADLEAGLDHRSAADPLYREVLDEARNRTGPESREAMDAFWDFAWNRAQLGDPGLSAQGVRDLQQILQLRRDRLGPGHPVTLDSANGVAGILYVAGRRTEAADLWRSVAGAPDSTPPSERIEQVVLARRALGGALLTDGDVASAYPFLRSAGVLIQQQVRDRRVTGGQERAAELLGEYRDVWLGQIRAGWALAHSNP